MTLQERSHRAPLPTVANLRKLTGPDQASQGEQITKIEAARELSISLEEGLVDINTKVLEAEVEMQAVKRQAADGQVTSGPLCC